MMELRNDRELSGRLVAGILCRDIRSKRIPPDLEARLFRKIQMIDDATTDQDLRVPASNHFEKLAGGLEGFHSIRVNKQWRLVFEWDGGRGEATGVYLDDHSYRR
jgi:toxin HigB-1